MIKSISNNSQVILFILLFLTFFSPSCASQEERLALAKQEVEIINSKLDKAEMVTGLMFRGENRYSYRAYFLDNKLVYIFSDINIGSRSASTNFYYFHKGNLIYLSQQEVGFDPVEKKRKRSIKTDIYFDGKEVLESVRIVSGNYAEVNKEELDEIQEEAEKLYNAAIEKKQSTNK
jgi:hypothetical protein